MPCDLQLRRVARALAPASGAASTWPSASIRSSISTTAANSGARLANRQIEQPRAVLIADVQDVAEAARRDQRRAGAAARDQGVGAARRAQPHGDRRNRLIEPQPEQVANGHERRVFVRSQLVRGALGHIAHERRGQLQHAGSAIEPRDPSTRPARDRPCPRAAACSRPRSRRDRRGGPDRQSPRGRSPPRPPPWSRPS